MITLNLPKLLVKELTSRGYEGKIAVSLEYPGGGTHLGTYDNIEAARPMVDVFERICNFYNWQMFEQAIRVLQGYKGHDIETTNRSLLTFKYECPECGRKMESLKELSSDELECSECSGCCNSVLMKKVIK